MAQPAEASGVFIEALVPIIAYLMAKDPEDYTYAIRNAEDCWYPPTCAVMTDLIPRLTNKDIEYSKDTAIADAQGTVNNVFEQFKDEALVQVYYPRCIANGYNSTTSVLFHRTGKGFMELYQLRKHYATYKRYRDWEALAEQVKQTE